MVLPPSAPEPTGLTAEELAAVPIFPLPRVVLLPGAALPLHVFEPRYRAMMHDCVTQGPRAIAMAMLAPGWEGDYEGRPRILPIAGVGRLVADRKNADGTYDLVLLGVARVRLEELPAGDLPYRRARAIELVDRVDQDEATLRRALEPVLATASSLATLERGAGPRVPSPALEGTPGAIADRLADRWIHETSRRQTILEAIDVGERIAQVGDTLATLLAMLSRAKGGSTPRSN